MLKEISDDLWDVMNETKDIIYNIDSDVKYEDGRFNKPRQEWLWEMTDEQRNKIIIRLEKLNKTIKELDKVIG